jgi:hypothetical protein
MDDPSDWLDEAGVIKSRHCKSSRNEQIEHDEEATAQSLSFPRVVESQIQEAFEGRVEALIKDNPDEDHDAEMPAEVTFYGSQVGHGKVGLEHGRGCMVNKVF